MKSTYLIDKIKNLTFFSSGHERSLKAKKNILAMFLIKGISIIINLSLIPLTIHYVNPTRYGIWLTLSSIISWFSFFDIGFGNGLRNKFTEAKAKGKIKLARTYISTTYGILSIIFISLWILFFIANFFINWCAILKAPSEMAGELSKLAIIVITFFCLQMILKVVNIIQMADQKPAKAAIYNTLGQIIALFIVFILTKTTTGSLIYLGCALGFSPILALIISSIWLFSSDYKKYAPTFSYIRFKYAKEIFGLGAKFFIIQIAAIIIYQTSNIIITQISGPDAVTVYNIAFRYFGVISMMFAIIITPFWSAFTDAYYKEDWTWMNNILKRLKQIWLILSIIAMAMILTSNYAYKLWIGSVVVVPISISIVMGLYVVINTWNGIYSQLLNGMGKIKLQFFSAIISSLLNIPLALILGRNFGIAGVVCSAIILSIFNAILMPIQLKTLLKKSAKGIWNE